MLGLKQLLMLLPAAYAYKFTLHKDAKCGTDTQLDFNSDNSEKGPIAMWLHHGGKTNHDFTVGSVRLDQLCAFRWNTENPEELFRRFWTTTGEKGKLSPLHDDPEDNLGPLVQFPAELAVENDPTCFPINPDVKDDKGEKINFDGGQMFYINDDLEMPRVFCPNNVKGPPEAPKKAPEVWVPYYVSGIGWTSTLQQAEPTDMS